MAINTDLIKQRLGQLKTQNNRQDTLWKPKPGKTLIRIVPYKYNKDNPFIELLFHYGIAGKTYLSPASFGRPDPILEMAEKLKSSDDKEDYKLGKKLEPKLRTFAPVIVRGELDKSGNLRTGTGSNVPKFWGFGKTVYQDILSVIADPDWGDITDIESGRDVVVEFKTAEETGKSFPETKISVKPKETPLTEDAEELKEIITSQKEITEIYKEPTYEQLTEALKAWLNGEDAPDGSSDETDEEVQTERVTPTKVKDDKNVKVAESVDDVKSKFDSLFNA